MPDTKLYCGTSGFAYSHWKPDFYPQNLPSEKLLAYYATRLNAVEVSYPARFASPARVQKWIALTPSGFLFVPKIPLNLENTAKLASTLPQSLQPLRAAGRLGPILFQLGSHCKADRSRLRHFLQLLPKDLPLVFEFRNVTWFDESVCDILRGEKAALCLTESDDLQTPWVLTADFVYLRLRKREYLESKLISMQYRVEQYLANHYPTFAIFGGGRNAAGALNAEKLSLTQRAMGASG